MRTALRWGRIRRLVHLSRDAIAGAVDTLRRRALLPLEGVRERLGLAGVSAATGAASSDLASPDGEHGRAPAVRRTRTESEPESEAEPVPTPVERASAPPEAPRRQELAAEAAAQLQHVALVVPPEPGAAEVARPARGPAPEPAEIPWGYGKDRVTAAAIDPNRLYVYWEVTDEAIARARAALGGAGDDAWLDLRVYDTTGVLFDGTNAHHHFDHGVGRSERQWFFHIGRPTSSVFVEVGLRARDGGFARVARSGRVEFPRAEPVPWTDPEWMTVVASTGEAQLAGRGMPAGAAPQVPAPGAPAPAEGGLAAAPQAFLPIPLWVIRDAAGHATWVRELTGSAWERVEWSESHGERWLELMGRVEWEGPRTFSTWEAGPFSYPVDVQEPTREEWEGRSIAYRVGGVTRVVHGPWQVVIRNLGAHASRSVVARWQIYRSWVAEGGREVRAGAPRAAPVGASEALAGASERAWASGSELRLSGASEVWRLGASELRYAGGSERLYSGASEVRARGASEQRLSGASEWRLGGGSEQVRRGASERLQQGASERLLGGASERVGASERRLGASEGRLAEPAPPGGYPRAE